MAAVIKRAAKSKKNRKHGRNKIWCTAYKNSGQREKNKVVRLKRHLARNPNDRNAVHLLANGGRRKAAS